MRTAITGTVLRTTTVPRTFPRRRTTDGARRTTLEPECPPTTPSTARRAANTAVKTVVRGDDGRSTASIDLHTSRKHTRTAHFTAVKPVRSNRSHIIAIQIRVRVKVCVVYARECILCARVHVRPQITKSCFNCVHTV